MPGEPRLGTHAKRIKNEIEKYVSELDQGKGDLILKRSNIGGNYTAYLRKVNFKEIEKTGWFGKKKKKTVKEYKPVMDIEYSAHTRYVFIYYDSKWKREAENLEKRIGKDVKLEEATFE